MICSWVYVESTIMSSQPSYLLVRQTGGGHCRPEALLIASLKVWDGLARQT